MSIDDFAKRAAGIDPDEPRRPSHPGFTRRDIEALVDAEVLRGWVVTRPWRVTLVLAGLILGSWCLLAGAVWTGLELWRWLR